MNTDEIEAFEESLPERIIAFCNQAPRTWDEIVGSMTGVSDPSRTTLDMEQVQRVHIATQVLWRMTNDGKVVRTAACGQVAKVARERGAGLRGFGSDPRFDMYEPAQ
ncbi:hypothetical protein [Sorangium sp. So ce693]|uniref:hypothetical protein n=1 Tax=Sorangium sp. So ce693 TaxID=3133318 RepID=UPI003F60685A